MKAKENGSKTGNIKKKIKANTHQFFDEMRQDKVGYLFLTLSLLLLLLICVQNWMYLCQNTNDDGAGDFLTAKGNQIEDDVKLLNEQGMVPVPSFIQ